MERNHDITWDNPLVTLPIEPALRPNSKKKTISLPT